MLVLWVQTHVKRHKKITLCTFKPVCSMLYMTISHCQAILYTQIWFNTLHLPSHTHMPIKSPWWILAVLLQGSKVCQSNLIQYAQPTRIKLSLACCPRCSDMSQHPWFYLIPGITFNLHNPDCIHVEIWALLALTYQIRIHGYGDMAWATLPFVLISPNIFLSLILVTAEDIDGWWGG